MPADLRARRDQLELEVESLRAKKPSMPEDQYYARLEPLLVQLARLYDGRAEAPGPALRKAPVPQPALDELA